MSSIDTRVVEMRFDNAQFEKGVAQTTKSLQNLNAQLEQGSYANPLEKLASGITQINFYPITNGLENAITLSEQLGNNLKASVTKGIDTVAGKIKGVVSMVTSLTKAGGLRRALSLDQAKFQLEGLSITWDRIYDDLEASGKGSSFSPGDLAKASAQFYASGVQLGEEMQNALRGVAGIAGATNSTYDEIADIFIAIAGKGYATKLQVDRISNRGLKASASIADYLNKLRDAGTLSEEIMASIEDLKEYDGEITSGVVDEMISSGLLSFDLFAAALNDKFGDHALEMNRTYEGAISAMKGSLGRVGADFAAPWLEGVRQMAISVQKIIDDVERGLSSPISGFTNLWGETSAEPGWSVVTAWKYNFGLVKDAILKGLNEIEEANLGQTLAAQFTPFVDAIFHSGMAVSVEAITDAFKGLNQVAKSGTFFKLLEPFQAIIWKIGDDGPKIVRNISGSLGDIFTIFDSNVKGISDFLYAATGGSKSLYDVIKNIDASAPFGWIGFVTKSLADFSKTLRPSEEVLKRVGEVGNVVRGTFERIGPIFERAGESLGRSIGSIAEDVPNALDGFARLLTSVLSPAVELFGATVEFAAPYIKVFADNFKDFFSDTFGDFGNVGTVFRRWADNIDSFVSSVKTFAAGDQEKSLANILGFFGDLLHIDTSSGQGWLSSILGLGHKFVDFVEDLGDVLSTLGGPIIGRFLSIPSKLLAVFKGLDKISDKVDSVTSKGDYLVDKSKGVGESLKRSAGEAFDFGAALEWVKEKIQNAATAVSEFVSNLTFGDVMKGVSAVLSGVFTGTFLKFQFFLAQLPKTLNTIGESFTSLIEAGTKVVEGLNPVAVLDKRLGEMTEMLGKHLKALQAEVKAEAVFKIAKAVGLLAVSMLLLSTIPEEKIPQVLGLFAAALAAVGGMMGGLSLMVKSFEKMTKNPKELVSLIGSITAIGVTITMLAGALFVLAAAVVVFSLIPLYALIKGGTAVAAFLLEFALLAKVMSGVQGDLIKAAASIWILSAALTNLVGAILVMTLLPVDKLIVGGMVLASMVAAFAVMADMLSGKTIPDMLKFSASLLVLSFAIRSLMVPILAFGMMDPLVLLKGVGAVGGIVLALGLFTALAKSAEKGLLGVAPLLLSVSAALLVFAHSAKIISDVPTEKLFALTACMGILLGALTAVAAFLSRGELKDQAKLIITANSLTKMSAAIMLLSLSLAVLGSLSLSQVLVGLVAIGGVLTTLTLLGAIIGKLHLEAAVTALAWSVTLLGIGLGATGLGLLLFAEGLMILGTLGPGIAENIGQSFDILAEHFAKQMSIIAEGLANAIIVFAKTIEEGAPQLSESSVRTILIVLTAIASFAGSFALVALELISGFILGIAAGLPMVIDALATLVVMAIYGMAVAVRDNGPVLVNAFEALGLSILRTLLEPIRQALAFFGADGWFNDLDQAIEDKLNVVEDAYSDKLDGIKKKSDEIHNALEGNLADPELADAAGDSGANAADSFFSSFASGIEGGDVIDISAIFSGSADTGQEAGEGVAKAFSSPIADLPSMLSGTTSEISESLDISDETEDSGSKSASHYIDGMIGAFRDRKSEPAGEAREVASEVDNAVRDEWGVASPSTVAFDIATFFTVGLINGLKSGADAVSSSSRDLAARSVDDTLATYGSGVSQSKLRSAGQIQGRNIEEGYDSVAANWPTHMQRLVQEAISACVKSVNGLPMGTQEGINIGTSFSTSIRASIDSDRPNVGKSITSTINEMDRKKDSGTWGGEDGTSFSTSMGGKIDENRPVVATAVDEVIKKLDKKKQAEISGKAVGSGYVTEVKSPIQTAITNRLVSGPIYLAQSMAEKLQKKGIAITSGSTTGKAFVDNVKSPIKTAATDTTKGPIKFSADLALKLLQSHKAGSKGSETGNAFVTNVKSPIKTAATDTTKGPIKFSADLALGLLQSTLAGDQGTTTGYAYTDGAAEAIEAGKEDHEGHTGTNTAAIGVAQDMASPNTAKKSGETTGGNFIQGIIDGLGSLEQDLKSKVDWIVELLGRCAAEGWEEHSPSRLTYRQARFFMLGFREGFASETDHVYGDVNDVVKNVGGSMDYLSGYLSDFDWDADPVITPVVDMSNMYAANGEIGRLFAGNSVYQAAWAGGYYGSPVPGSNTGYFGDNYNINLDYTAGEDANALVLDMARAMKTRALLKG